LTLSFGIAFGLLWPAPGVYIASEVGPEEINVAQYIFSIIIFLFNGLTLKTSELKKLKNNIPGMRRTDDPVSSSKTVLKCHLLSSLAVCHHRFLFFPAFSIGFVSILFVTSILGVAFTGFLDADVFFVPEFRTGLQVFFATPTTVNSGILLTGEANGNVTLSLILTVNML
jgi:hypothetical protein